MERKPYGIQSLAVQLHEKWIEADVYLRRLAWTADCRPAPKMLESDTRFLDDETLHELVSRGLDTAAALPLTTETPMLPPGALHGILLRLTDQTGTSFYYTNTEAKDFFVEQTPAAPAAAALAEWLADMAFVQADMQTGETRDIDPRYLEETLWACEQCGFGNPFCRQTCAQCGAPRHGL